MISAWYSLHFQGLKVCKSEQKIMHLCMIGNWSSKNRLQCLATIIGKCRDQWHGEEDKFQQLIMLYNQTTKIFQQNHNSIYSYFQPFWREDRRIGKQWSYETWDKTVNYSWTYNAKYSTEFVLHFLVPSSICRKSKLLIAFCVSPPPSPLVVLLLLLPLLDIVLLPANTVAEDAVVAAVFSDTCNDLGSSDSCVRPRPRLQESRILRTVIILHSTEYFTFNTRVIFLKTARQNGAWRV
jgi:hypothetical protein